MTHELLVATIAALFFSRILVPPLAHMLRGVLVRANFRGDEVPVGVGLLFPLVASPILLAYPLAGDQELLSVIAILGFAVAGLVDDCLGDRSTGGFAGHARSLLRGRLTTGGLKALYGGVIAFMVAMEIDNAPLEVLVNTLLVALYANFVNLLDVRPGRAGKVFLLWVFVFWIAGSRDPALLVMAACLCAYLPWDLGAKAMMGDVGSNVLGVVVGLAATGLGIVWKVALVILLVAVHLYAELHSISDVVRDNAILRWFDQWGQKTPS